MKSQGSKVEERSSQIENQKSKIKNRRSFTFPSFAKINLSLRVLGKRADGFHEIRTIFQTVTLHDELTFEPLEGGRFELRCDAPDIPVDETNLISRAAVALREHFTTHQERILASNVEAHSDENLNFLIERFGARVRLAKRIPAGGGLGGGSSNAAVALWGLARLWRLQISVEELSQIAARLGSDAPFFLTGGTCFGAGRGTEIRPLEDLPKTYLLIVAPLVHVSTAEAYRELNAAPLPGERALTKTAGKSIFSVSGSHGKPDSALGFERWRNDFEPVVFRRYPAIEAARDALIEQGARRAMLSGSGASVFGTFDSEAIRDRACAALRETQTRWRTFSCETLSRDEYRKAFAGLLN